MPLELLILLAIIQGLTEFLPISSSAHLILPSQLGLIEDQGVTIDVAVHVGSLLAVMLYFRRDVAALVVGMFQALGGQWTRDARMFVYLAGASIPVLIVGFIFAMLDWDDAMRSIELIGWMSIIFGVALYEADRVAMRYKTMDELTWTGAMSIGIAQVLALFPGTSRSGITMTAARFLGFERSEAARFSMLLSIPVILAAGAVKGLEVVSSGDAVLGEAVMWSLALSFISAYIAIWFFMTLVDRIGMLPFVVYRVVLGILLLSYVYWLHAYFQ